MLVQLPAGKCPAFTLVEVLVVIILIGMLITAAVPGYKDLMRNTQANSLTARLSESFRLAQAEALKRGLPVTVCPIAANFNPTAAFNETVEEWPCQNTNTWTAWKVFVDPNFNGTEDFSDGWPVIQYVKSDVAGAITSNLAGRITFDNFGFANINPTVTRTGWTWSSSYSSGAWSWSYGYSSEYGGAYYRIFTIAPNDCTGDSARILELNQNGVQTITNTTCS